MSINYLLATKKEKRNEVIGSALNLYFQYDYTYPVDLFFEDISPLEKEKDLIRLFHSVRELRNFLDYFPHPKIKTIRGIESPKLKNCYREIRKSRERLENSVLRTSLKYYLYCEEKGPLFDSPPLSEIEKHFLEAVFYGRDLIK